MKTYIHALILTAALLLPACKTPPPPPNAIHEDGMVFTREPLIIYPDAAYVELYFGEDVQYDAHGIQAPADAQHVRLTPEQRARIEAAFSRRHIYIPPTEIWAVGCFNPHHFFRYYDKDGHQVGEIKVCFCCGGAQFVPQVMKEKLNVDERHTDLPAIEALVKSMDIPTDDYCQ